MSKTSINPDGMAPPMGPYAHVTVAPPGARLVFCAGAIAVDKEGNVVGEGDIVAQTRQVMENLRLALEAAGADFSDIVKITNYVTDVGEYGQIGPTRNEYLKPPYPASSMVEVKALMYPELKIEIEAIAVVHDD
jgi:reactive intermediate/imine deaminase